jgi:hypothetical protein
VIQFVVYVIAPDTGFPCKVGVAENVRKRLAALQTAHWEELHIYHTFEVASRGDAFRLERLTHKRLKEHHIRGEWFNVLVSDAYNEINQMLDERKDSVPLIYNDKRKRRVLQHVV